MTLRGPTSWRARVAKRLSPADGARLPPPEEPRTPASQWFWDHYEMAAGEIATVCEHAAIGLADQLVADIGCGDGIMALGLLRRARPRRIVGFDVNPVNTEILLARSREEGVGDTLPEALEFRASTPTSTPASDGEFDFAYSWSAFEHIADPIAVLREIYRILKPGAGFFLQLWPFYRSAKGSHLWEWFPEEFHHLLGDDDAIIAAMHASDRHTPEWTRVMAWEYQHLNRITLEQLQRAVLTVGFDVRRVELITYPTVLPPALARYAWADLAISGIKLLATRRP